MNIFKRRLVLAMLLSCGFGSAHADVVISQVYGGGGNSGAPLNRDFVELHNNGSTSVSLSGWSVQYASATGTTWQVTALSGSIAPGAYYLVQQGTVGANGAPLPTADATGTIAMSGTAGKVALSAGTTALTGSCPTGNADFVGFGTTANCAEASAPTPAPSNTTAVIRADGGCTDTNNNAADFAAVAPNPRNSASTTFNCGPTLPVLSISDQARRERNVMSQAEMFSVQLSQPAGVGGVSFSYTVTAGTATSGVDYIGTGGNATIPEGSSSGFVSFAITGDTDIEGDETVLVTLGSIVGASAGDTSAVITITDDDAPPQISISDTATTEGDSGTKQFLFTISLGSPAPQGGVSVDYATADGTGAAGSDYVAADATASIAEGLTSITIGVNVNGDGDIEADETFVVNLSNAVGGTLADSQGVGTITNDDVAITPIHDVQGNGATSPYADQTLYTRGIVTGRKSNGFFMQAPDADADADPATSEGIFVFTSAAPPAAAAVGNLVRVEATVSEFIPSTDPGQAPMTELGFATVTQLSSGNPLPTAVPLTTTFPDPSGALDQLERVEGMRVTAASFTVVAATGGNTNEPNATGTSNGIFNVVVTGVPRPFREPGIQAPDQPPVGSGTIPPIPRWDFNPELLTVDSDALGATTLNLSAGATITGLTGPLDFGFRRYTVLAEAAPAVAGGLVVTAARAPTADEFTVAGYNLERFFDTVNDPAIGEPVLTAPAFANRLNKASLGIRDYLNTPDIVGVVEIENLTTLQAVAAKISSDSVAASQPDPEYVAYLEEGNDVGGIDVGFLVKSAEIAAGIDRVEVVAVTQHGKATTWVEPDSSSSLLNDRPPLALDAVVHYTDGRAFPITVVVVHQRSLNGAEEDSASGVRVRAKRQEQAEFLATLIDGMQQADPQRRITVLGDFNAFEFNDGFVDAMHVVEGIPVPDNETVVAGDGIDLVDPDLFNLAALEDEGQRYSFVFGGNAQSLDHVIVNQVLGADVASLDLDHARINADFPEINRNDANSPSRLADHDPAVAYFQAPSLLFANLETTASASAASVNALETFGFDASVTNNGPDAAEFVGVGFAVDRAISDFEVTAPPGWNCDPTVIVAGTTSVACNISALANGASATFQLTGTAWADAAESAIHLAVLADAETVDPDEADNEATAMVNVVAVANLEVGIDGPIRSPSTVRYRIGVTNDGPNVATEVNVRLRLDVPAAIAPVVVPEGWDCDQAAVATLDVTCALPEALMISDTQVFAIDVPAAYNKPQYRLRAEVSSAVMDSKPANNVATRRLGIPQR